MKLYEAEYTDSKFKRTSQSDMDIETQARVQDQAKKRKEGQDLSEGKRKAEKGSQDHTDFKTGQKQMRDASEVIGEESAIAAMKQHFPDAEVVYVGKGSGTFNIVMKRKNSAGKTEYFIVEAKGGSSKLGDKVIDGKLFQQGTSEYRKSIVKQMRKSSDPDIKDIGRKLYQNNKRVKYYHAQTPIDSKGNIKDTVLKEFK